MSNKKRQAGNPIFRLIRMTQEGIRQKLQGILLEAFRKVGGKGLDINAQDISVTASEDPEHGDYASNFAMVVAKKMGKNPRDLAVEIVKNIDAESVQKAEVAGPGFINFTLESAYLIEQVKKITGGPNKSSLPFQGKKIAVEYTDPNPFKEFHLGHMYSNFIGESISRLFEAIGAEVWRGDFYGDVGMHIAKSLYGLLAKFKIQNSRLRPTYAKASAGRQGFGGQTKLKTLQGDDYINELKNEISKLEQLPISERQKLLGEGYALGVIKYDEDKQIQEEIKNLNLLIYVAAQEILEKNKGWQPIINYRQYIRGEEDKLARVTEVYEAGLRWSLEYFESIYKILGTKFDGYYPESWVGEYGMKMVEEGLEKGVLEKSDGSIVYRGEKDGLHTRVFVNKLGLPTYEAKDLGLAYAKYQDFKYDLSINVFGKEIDEYYKVVRAALTKINPELGEKATYIAHGMVKLPQGKMSSRTGNVVTFEGLLDEASARTMDLMSNMDIKEEEKDEVARKVGLGAIRYALLKSSPGMDVVFDFDKSITFEGDSGPYLMYTYARCKSVMRKAEDVSGIKYLVSSIKNIKNIQNTKYKILDTNQEERNVLRLLARFEEAVVDAVVSLSPNTVCSYLFKLAQAYNLFYAKHSILGISNKNSESSQDTSDGGEAATSTPPRWRDQTRIDFRLFLTEATAEILKRGLYLLGIETVERM